MWEKSGKRKVMRNLLSVVRGAVHQEKSIVRNTELGKRGNN